MKFSGRFKSPEELDENDFRRHGPRFTGQNLDANLGVDLAVSASQYGRLGHGPGCIALVQQRFYCGFGVA